MKSREEKCEKHFHEMIWKKKEMFILVIFDMIVSVEDWWNIFKNAWRKFRDIKPFMKNNVNGSGSDEEKHKAKTAEKILEKEFITHINLLNIST